MVSRKDDLIDKFKDRIIVGFKEKVIIIGDKKSEEVIARVDTGAKTSSIDITLASKLKLGPIVETRFIRSASGEGIRPLIHAKMKIRGKEINTELTIANRSHLNYPVLIGRNILKRGFIIDPDKK